MLSNALGAVLELKPVGDIAGRFYVARYQRGYRWTSHEVSQLLEDIWTNGGTHYNLQPVVVKRRSEGEWELVDGQQRLTTLYLIFLYMQRESLQSFGPAYSICYQTRPGSESYLQSLSAASSKSNIDFFHLHAAYECIRRWFEGHGHKRQHVANKFYGYLFDFVRVIWYEVPPEIDATTLFTRLNVGRIPLTDAELVKAALLSRRPNDTHADRAKDLAAQWDSIERDLHNPDLWSFVTDANDDQCPTRITLLLDTIAGGPRGPLRPRFHTFNTLREAINGSPGDFWESVIDLHGLLLGWFEDRNTFHKIGYLVATGEAFADLVALASGQAKSAFDALLDQRIRDKLKLNASELSDLNYEQDRKKSERVLLLMNVETIRRQENSTERYPFHSHRKQAWSLEHIHAQNTESLTKAEQWTEWLRLHREALLALPNVDGEQCKALVARIDAARETINRQSFQELARDITEIFTLGDADSGFANAMHSVSNLALLSSGANSALGNGVFEVKRRRILELDRNGAYIPICTRQVFLKYYTDANAQQIHFWSSQDRESYLNAMISVVKNYLKPEQLT